MLQTSAALVVFGLLITIDDSAAELLKKAVVLRQQGKFQEALELADKSVALDPKNSRALLVRGLVHESFDHHAKAIADFDKVLELEPNTVEVYHHRGCEHFKLGHIRESLADFDKFLELKPEARPGHWQRGITCYYAGRFEDGAKQFAGYEAVDTNDVENAVWHFLCNARQNGVDMARKSLLKIGRDRRVPLMQVYALFRGDVKPDAVLVAAREGNPDADASKQRMFYAHLYLGLFFDVTGDERTALEHMELAAGKFNIGHYMGDVARVHRDLLRKKRK